MLEKTPKYLQTDRACVVRAQNNEAEALRVLYQRYLALIYHELSLKVTCEDDLLGLLNEIFQEAFSKLHQLKAPQSFGKWIVTITRHKLIDYLRKRQADKISLVADYEAVSDADERDPLETAQHNNPLAKTTPQFLSSSPYDASVRAVLKQLTPLQAQILGLTVAGYQSSEIAQMIGSTASAVRQTLKYAKAKFRKIYLQNYQNLVYCGGEQNEAKKTS